MGAIHNLDNLCLTTIEFRVVEAICLSLSTNMTET